MTNERISMSYSDKVGTNFPGIVNSESVERDFSSGILNDTVEVIPQSGNGMTKASSANDESDFEKGGSPTDMIEVIPQSGNGEMEASNLHAYDGSDCEKGGLQTDVIVKIEREDDRGEMVWFSDDGGERQGAKSCQESECETNCGRGTVGNFSGFETNFDNKTPLIQINSVGRMAEIEAEPQNRCEVLPNINDDSSNVEYINVTVKVEDMFPSDSQDLVEAHSSSEQWQRENCGSRYLSENLEYEEETLFAPDVGEAFTIQESAVSIDSGPIQCEKCAMVFEDLFALIVHMRTHSGRRILECTLCPAKLPGETSLRRHLKLHDDGKRLKCEQCPARFRLSRELQLHARVHTGERPFQCEQCLETFIDKSSLNSHVKRGHNEQTFSCAICTASFKSMARLTAHEQEHNGGKPFKCTLCPATFMRRNGLGMHTKQYHRKGALQCPLCLASFKREPALDTHLKTHERPFFKCSMCSASFKKRSHLEIHSSAHTGQSFECKLCSAKFPAKYILDSHFEVHTGEKPFKCRLCPSGFAAIAALRDHLKDVHTDPRSYKCQWCPAYFKLHSSLTVHWKLHGGGRPFSCYFCPASCKTSSSLVKHLKVHSNEERSSVNCQDLRQERLAFTSDAVENLDIDEALLDRLENLQKSDSEDEYEDFSVNFQTHCVKEESHANITDTGLDGSSWISTNNNERAETEKEPFMSEAQPKIKNTQIFNDSNIVEHLNVLVKPEDLTYFSSESVTDTIKVIPQSENGEMEASSHTNGESENFPKSNSAEESEYSSAYFQTSCIKEECYSDDGETGFDNGSCWIPTNSGRAETEEEPLTSEEQLEINNDSDTVEHMDVSVKPEDLFPNDPEELDEALSSSGQFHEESSDSQHFSDDCEYGEEPPFSYAESTESGNSVGPFLCEQCPELCEDLFTFSMHRRKHISGKYLECALCPAKFMGTGNLKRHLKVHGYDKPFECEQCPARFKRLSQFQIHWRYHSGDKPFECKRCPEKFVSRGILNAHLKDKHTDKRRHVCGLCHLRFRFKSHLQAHLDEHIGAKPFKCELCPIAFARSFSLQQHLTEVHSGGPFRCELCLATFYQQWALDVHLKSHESPFFKCTLCPASFKKRSYLKAHTEAHTGAWVYSCHLCSAKFKTPALLKSHMKMHSGENPFKCKLCSAGFARVHLLRSHLKIVHTDAKPFKCPHCPAYFSLRSAKMLHLKMHFGGKPFICNYCPASFKFLSALTVHLNVHREGKRFKCDYCSASFARPSTLKCHLSVHEEEYPSVNAAQQDLQEAVFAAPLSQSDLVESSEIKQESPGILETFQNSDRNTGEESEEPPMDFEAGCSKEENDADNIETHLVIGSSSTLTDNKGSIDEIVEEPPNRPETLLKIKTVARINVSVVPEDLPPSDSQELRKTNLSGGQCQGEYSGSDSQHQDVENNLGPFQCEKCSVICEDLFTLSVHTNTHSDEKFFYCPLCPIKFPGKTGLQTHLKIHTDGKRFKCEHCPAKFRRSCEYKTHLNLHCGKRQFKCEQCSAAFARKTALIFHLKGKHSEVLQFACKQCPARLKSKAGLEDHLKRNCAGKPHKCAQCPSTFLKHHSLQKHVKKFHDKSAFECALCFASFDQELALNNHTKAHESPFFKCSRCSASFKERTSLEVHEKEHSDALSYECELCSVKFPLNFSLESHLKVHSGEYPLKCKLCPAGFPKIGPLRHHVKSVHFEARNFKCTRCPAYFKQYSALLSHTKVHTGQKLYQCNACSASFMKPSCLTMHLKVHNRKEPPSVSGSQDLPGTEFASSSSPYDLFDSLEIKEEIPDTLEDLQKFDVGNGEECQDSLMTFEATAYVPMEISGPSCTCEVSLPCTSTNEPSKCSLCIKQEIEQ